MTESPLLADSHGHLSMVWDAEGRSRLSSDVEVSVLVARARDAGVTRILVPGTTRTDAPRAVEIAERYDGVYAAVGIHPHEAKDFDEDVDLKLFAELARSPKVVAIGEIGLDFHYDHSPRDVQRATVKAQIAFARERGLPVILHNRLSEADLLPILEGFGPGEPGRAGVFHSFCASPEVGRRALDLGYCVSYSGMITFKAADNVRESARELPLSSMLVETDAPFLAPVPYRGKSNEPAYVVKTAARLAEVKGVPFVEVAATTTAAFCRLFRV